jgi:hypothetical protein
MAGLSGPKPHFSEAQRAQILHLLFVADVTAEAVATRFSVSVCTIRRLRRTYLLSEVERSKNGDVRNGSKKRKF